ncbi:MAG: DinB family protein [Pirellulales bacterium]|nr:DinB family protein [Pirellulales bacterium]
MSTIGPMIAASAQLGLGYAERLLKDVQPGQFARFACVGDSVIESNHPAFIYGHLGLYSSRVIEGLGADASAFEPADQFTELFSKDAQCVDDPEGTIYPEMEQITSLLFDGYRAAVEALRAAPDDIFANENPNEAARDRFPTIGAMYTFYVGGHFMVHMGQMSAWRRVMGLGAC